MTRRLSVSLEPDDERIIRAFRDQEGAERAALVARAGGPGSERGGASEAAIARALLRVGAEAIRADLLEAGYAALAFELGPREDAEHRHAETLEARRRYVDRTERISS